MREGVAHFPRLPTLGKRESGRTPGRLGRSMQIWAALQTWRSFFLTIPPLPDLHWTEGRRGTMAGIVERGMEKNGENRKKIFFFF